jgi:hypothetical protein
MIATWVTVLDWIMGSFGTGGAEWKDTRTIPRINTRARIEFFMAVKFILTNIAKRKNYCNVAGDSINTINTTTSLPERIIFAYLDLLIYI